MAPGSTRPTSRDVAQAAGVSQAAVSLVLGDKWRGRVSAATADRVREAARELGYRPNLAARNLRLGRTRTVLLVVPALTTEFFAGVYTGAARVAAQHGFGVVLYPSPEGIGPARDPFGSAPAALDGVLASSMAADALTAIRGDQLPLVMLDSDPAGSLGAATVNLDIADATDQGCGSDLTLRRFTADLDADRPIVRSKNGADAGRVIPAAHFPYRVSAADPEVLLVDATTQTSDARWYLELDWSCQGRTGTVRIDDHGRPFRTTGIKKMAHFWYGTNDAGTRAWVPYDR
ncbi:LacI family DNA-binding transcriptional regulator [Streptomyces sp. NPDC005568]|uniref:LacI family DNA-binding transcriptional regulator n=1 Tax=Streptomyces sp. NPDC005568 TaxID=3156887 RepID=UPI0033AE5EC0